MDKPAAVDEQLLRDARREPEAFAAFYRRRGPELQSWFRARVPYPEAADDLLAETFAQALRSLYRFRGSETGAAGAWLYGIAANLLRQFYRRNHVETKARRRLAMSLTTHVAFDTDEIDSRQDALAVAKTLNAAVESLPADQRKAIKLRVLDQLPYADVAQSLNCSVPTARMRVSRGLRALGSLMEGAWT